MCTPSYAPVLLRWLIYSNMPNCTVYVCHTHEFGIYCMLRCVCGVCVCTVDEGELHLPQLERRRRFCIHHLIRQDSRTGCQPAFPSFPPPLPSPLPFLPPLPLLPLSPLPITPPIPPTPTSLFKVHPKNMYRYRREGTQLSSLALFP